MDHVLAAGREPLVQQVNIEIAEQEVAWKKTRQVLHTEEEPPNHGRIILAMIGWI
jgi:hypothetical protein